MKDRTFTYIIGFVFIVLVWWIPDVIRVAKAWFRDLKEAIRG